MRFAVRLFPEAIFCAMIVKISFLLSDTDTAFPVARFMF